jgi:hypothetical protein
MVTDCKVQRRTRDQVKELTRRVLSQAGITDPNFSITKLLRAYEKGQLTKGKRSARLKIELCDVMPDHTPFAYVNFEASVGNAPDKITLYCHREIWKDAEIGEPSSREILAHELGHIVMHDHFALPFSSADSQRLHFISPEESAECQAELFSDFILLPDNIAKSMQDKETILQNMLVPEKLVDRRLEQINLKLPKSFDLCENCGCAHETRLQFVNLCDDCARRIQF